MNKKFTNTPLADEHLQSLEGMKEVQTDDFFYTRLRAKMISRQKGNEKISLKWVYATVTVMLVILAVNISVWEKSTASSGSSVSSIHQLVQEYGWASHDLYSANTN